MPPSVILIMGVSGCGKTTVAERLAARLRWQLAEADDFHTAASIAKMRGGSPLTDEDRWPWLAAMRAWIDTTRGGGQRCVVACSALKRAYRERLAGGRDDVRLVHLAGSYELIATRMAGRKHAYMPAGLLQSQFDTLEPPGPEENPLVLAVEEEPARLVERIVAELALRPA
jgi:gluconokinase